MDRATVSIVLESLGTLVFASQIIAVPILLLALLGNLAHVKPLKKLGTFFSDNAYPFAFLVATVATLGSLFLSEMAHFTPCKLCWFQRIFMYPQVILLGIAMWKNEYQAMKKYVLALSVIGLLIAIYHYALQMFPTLLPCTDEVASCAARQYSYFGYITIPMMSLTAFLMIILLVLGVKGKK